MNVLQTPRRIKTYLIGRVDHYKRLHLLSDKRISLYWNIIDKPTDLQQKYREEYKIDVIEHIKKFDPSGKTVGCGCAMCGEYKRIKDDERKLNIKKSLVDFIDKVKHRKKKKYSVDTLYFKGVNLYSIVGKTDKELTELRRKLTGEIKTLEKDISYNTETLQLISKLTGIPVQVLSRKSINDYAVRSDAKDELIEIKDFDKLSFNDSMRLATSLNLFTVDEDRLQSIRKNLNLKSKVYFNIYADLWRKRIYLPSFKIKTRGDRFLESTIKDKKGKKRKNAFFRFKFDVNKVQHDITKERAQQALDGLLGTVHNILKDYRGLLVSEFQEIA